MTLTITPAQFAGLQAFLAANSSKDGGGLGITLTPSLKNPNAGTLQTHDLLLDYSYDGTASLGLVVARKLSLAAKFAPESVIEAHITELFNGYIHGGTAA